MRDAARELRQQLGERARDGASPSERKEAMLELAPLLRAAARDPAAAPAATAQMLALDLMQWTLTRHTTALLVYVGGGELHGYADAAELASCTVAATQCMLGLFDGWGCRDHPQHRHDLQNAFYSSFPAMNALTVEQVARGGGPDSEPMHARLKELAQLTVDGSFFTPHGGIGIMCIVGMYFNGPNAKLGRSAAEVLVFGGVFEAAASALRESPLDSLEIYTVPVSAATLFGPYCDDAAMRSRLFSSGVVEAVVACTQRAQASEVSQHVSSNRGLSQLLVGVAGTVEGRAQLLATPGLEDALIYLLEHGGDPVGIAANRTVADPRGMAGLSLALLRGREEDTQLALPAKVVAQICEMIETGVTFGVGYVLPHIQGLAELAVSDANKEHLVRDHPARSHPVFFVGAHFRPDK